MSHVNNGSCGKCQEIIAKYPDFNAELGQWFQDFQSAHPSAHVSCAGRGRIEQESDFHRGASRAHFGQSAHNYNCALDLFVMQQGLDLYDKEWFEQVVAPNLEPWIDWYGAKGAPFYELPHVEVRTWKDLVANHMASLVE